MLVSPAVISGTAGLLPSKAAPVLWRVFGCSHKVEHHRPPLIALGLCVSTAKRGLAPSPTLSLHLKSSNSGLSAGDTEGFGGVPFQSSLQPLARLLPHHCYHSSISEEQPLTEAGVPSSASTTSVHPLGKMQPTSRAAPGPWRFAQLPSPRPLPPPPPRAIGRTPG